MGIAEIIANNTAKHNSKYYPIARSSTQRAERFPTDEEMQGIFSPIDDPPAPLPQQSASSSSTGPPPQPASSSSAAPPPANRQEGEPPKLPVDRADDADDDDNDQKTDWHNYDLGRALAIFRDGTEAAKRRALTKLHRRLWHAPASRMRDILSAAGVPDSTCDLVGPIVDACHVCRLWQRPGKRSIALSRLTTTFNDIVQIDLLFVNKWIIVHMIDEATRWTMTRVLRTKDADTLLQAITTTWVHVWGPMRTLVTDEESGLHGDQSSIWAERLGVNMKYKEPGTHATMVERHHQILREAILHLVAECALTDAEVPFDHLVAEATFAKNAILVCNGDTPFHAVTGRTPHVLAEFEAPRTSTDGASITRLRELALAAITEATAKARLQRALNSNTRRPLQDLKLETGDLVDIYRKPATKEESGWRGPAKVVTMQPDSGQVTVRWQGRHLDCRAGDVRKHLVALAFIQLPSIPLDILRRYVHGLRCGTMTASWVYGPRGWVLSRTAQEHPTLFNAILRVASCEMHIIGCVGGRIGQGVQQLPGLPQIDQSTSALLAYRSTN